MVATNVSAITMATFIQAIFPFSGPVDSLLLLLIDVNVFGMERQDINFLSYISNPCSHFYQAFFINA